VAWFTFDPQLSGGNCAGMNFMNDNRTVSADGWEHCVALGSVGFSRGVHYWEFTIDKYSADTDPAFGIARIDVSRDKMLGKFRLSPLCACAVNGSTVGIINHNIS
jgi:tripartite motif-containing protein 9/67